MFVKLDQTPVFTFSMSIHIEVPLSEKLSSRPGERIKGNIFSQRKLQSKGIEENNTGKHFVLLNKCTGFLNNNYKF